MHQEKRNQQELDTESSPSPSNHHSGKATISPSGQVHETTKEQSKMGASKRTKELGRKLAGDKSDAKKKEESSRKGIKQCTT